MGRSGNDVPGALLHNTIAPVMRERPLSVSSQTLQRTQSSLAPIFSGSGSLLGHLQDLSSSSSDLRSSDGIQRDSSIQVEHLQHMADPRLGCHHQIVRDAVGTLALEHIVVHAHPTSWDQLNWHGDSGDALPLVWATSLFGSISGISTAFRRVGIHYDDGLFESEKIRTVYR
ncbi:hypothetical protein Tco_0997422 [Tanacetum coccineum]